MSITASRRWPRVAFRSDHTPDASGPRHDIVSVIASISARWGAPMEGDTQEPPRPTVVIASSPKPPPWAGRRLWPGSLFLTGDSPRPFTASVRALRSQPGRGGLRSARHERSRFFAPRVGED